VRVYLAAPPALARTSGARPRRSDQAPGSRGAALLRLRPRRSSRLAAAREL